MSQKGEISDKVRKRLPVYCQAWWLDIVCGTGNWQYIPLYNGAEEVGVFALFEKKALGINYITMPHFTPHLGPYLIYPEGMKSSSKLSFDEKVLDPVLDVLTTYSVVELNLHPGFKNIFPFYKKGFRDRIRYTYIIRASKGLDAYLKNINQKLRKEIDRNTSEIKVMKDANGLFSILSEVENSKRIGNEESRAIRMEMDRALVSKRGRSIFGAFEGGKLLGGIYIVEDKDTNYLMFTAQNQQSSKSGVIAKLIDHAIKLALEDGKDFDFEGSMIPGVERFFRRFGGELAPYHVISKEKNFLMKLLKGIKK